MSYNLMYFTLQSPPCYRGFATTSVRKVLFYDYPQKHLKTETTIILHVKTNISFFLTMN